MGLFLPLFALATGCLSGGYLTPFGDDFTYSGDGNGNGHTTDTSANPDSGDGTIDDTGDGTPPEPETDFSVWTGERVVSYDEWSGCEDTLYESGTLVGTGRTVHGELVNACPSCTHFYYIELDPDEICGWINISSTTYRGIVLGNDWGAIYRLSEDGAGGFNATALSTGAAWDGSRLAYDYVAEIYGIELEIVGWVQFPVTE